MSTISGYDATVSACEGHGALFLSHYENDKILRHFSRLKGQLSRLMPVYHVRQVDDDDDYQSSLADIRVGKEDFKRNLPLRYREFEQEKLHRPHISIGNGYADLVIISAACCELLKSYDYIWIVEYDVDFSGNWEYFFERCSHSRSDLIASRIRLRSEDPGWYHWSWFEYPPEIGLESVASSFIPIARFSRRLIEAYSQLLNQDGWWGNVEATIATVAMFSGFQVEDLLPEGHFAVKKDRYFMSPDTFGYRPVRKDRYFFDCPDAYCKANYLYHPVKYATGQPLR